MNEHANEWVLLEKVLEIYDQKFVASHLNEISPIAWSREMIKELVKGKSTSGLSPEELLHLERLLPQPLNARKKRDFDFIDLFAGIGGIRRGFEEIGGRCVFTSEWNKYA